MQNSFVRCTLNLLGASLLVLAPALSVSCGGGGSTGNSQNSGPGAASKLFVYDLTNASIYSRNNMDLAAGSAQPDRTIKGANALVTFAVGMTYDSAKDRLYVSVDDPFATRKALLAFNHASTANGNVVPDLVVNVPAGALFVDSATDTLYVAYTTAGMGIYNHASQMTSSATADRTLTFQNASCTSFAIDTTRSILYVNADRSGRIFAFDGIDSLDGLATANRQFQVPKQFDCGGLAIDPTGNRLYCTDIWAGVNIVASASTASGNQAPALITLPNPTHAAYDVATDRLYVSGYENLIQIANARTATSGTVGLYIQAPSTSMQDIAF